MASKRPSPGSWQVVLEEMRSQNRATIETVEAFRASIEERIDRLDRKTRDRGETLGRAIVDLRREVRQNTVDVRDLKVMVQENTVELRTLSRRVDALNRLEERVSALEKRAQ